MTGLDGAAEPLEETIRIQVRTVEERLVVELGDRIPHDMIRATVRTELDRLSQAAVRQYIPLLVGRAARAELSVVARQRRPLAG